MADSGAQLRHAVTRISLDREIALNVVARVIERAGAILERRNPRAWVDLGPLANDARRQITEWGTDEDDAELEAWRDTAAKHRTSRITDDQHALRAIFEALMIVRRWRQRNAEMWWPGDPVNECVKALVGSESDPAGVLLGDVLTAAGFSEGDHDVAARVADQVATVDEWRSAVERLTRRR